VSQEKKTHRSDLGIFFYGRLKFSEGSGKELDYNIQCVRHYVILTSYNYWKYANSVNSKTSYCTVISLVSDRKRNLTNCGRILHFATDFTFFECCEALARDKEYGGRGRVGMSDMR